MKTVAIAQARMGSTRFPGKVMKQLGSKPVLRWVVDALQQAPGVDHVVVATSTQQMDGAIEEYCNLHGIDCFRGSESDVLARFYLCAIKLRCKSDDIILRITCDCPFIDPYVTGQVVHLLKSTGADYASNQPTWPDGLDVECFTFEALETAWIEATRPSDRDCVTQFIIRNQSRFPAEYLVCPFPGAYKERWVLDTEQDFDFCQRIAVRVDRDDPPSCMEIMNILDAEPELRKINAGAIRNERFYESLADERLPERVYTRSNTLLQRASADIPLGSQTFSKSHLFYPTPAAPLYVTHGDGARIFDVDGNDYVDLVNALLPVILGYRDPDVDDAVRRQLNRAGMSFSLATELEDQLAGVLCRLIPCAEMVKFGKSGTDVTTAAIRLARAITGKDHVLVGGYHGWADWSMATDPIKSAGIPYATAYTSHAFKYGDRRQVEVLLSLWRDNIAAIIVEPTKDLSFLDWLRHICTKGNIILIFDEIQTGFRYSMGGAQKWFDITPDLACFGKSMGNGMPISALVGPAWIMQMMMTGRVFYSGTFFGDTLSIVAALATIQKMEQEKVINHLWQTGIKIQDGINNHKPPTVEFSGAGSLRRIQFTPHHNATAEQQQALFTQEMAQQGVLILNCNGISYAHKEPEIRRIIKAYRHTFDMMNECLEKQGEIEKLLKGEVKGIGVR